METTNQALVTALNSAQQMLMSVACQPSDVLCEQLRANLRAEAISAVEVLRGAAQEADPKGQGARLRADLGA